MGIRVSGLLARADQVQISENLISGLSLLQGIRMDVKMLMKDLVHHERWEEENVFPLTSKYYKQHLRPSIIPSISVLEKEHDLVKQCFQPFLNLSEEILVHTPVTDLRIYGKLRLCIVYLYQGGSLLKEHFELEEGLIYPLLDEILAEVE
jgi:hemerythrin superfamily protein